MSYAVGVVAFSLALLLSVMLHEAGHFVTAKAFGMKASRFFVGFGPTLWSFKRGETEYGVKAIPAGGFVKIEGMTALEELAPEDEDRAFYKQPARQRVVVLCAGSFVHFLIAIFLVFGILAATGQDPINGGTTGVQIGQCRECVTAERRDGICSRTIRMPLPTGTSRPVTSWCRSTAPRSARPASSRSHLRAALVTGAPHRRADGQPAAMSLVPVAVPQGRQTVGRIGIAPTFANNPVSFGIRFREPLRRSATS